MQVASASTTMLTRSEAMEMLRLKPAFFSKVVNGKVRHLPQIPYVRIGRRQLFRKESLEGWILKVEGQCSAAH